MATNYEAKTVELHAPAFSLMDPRFGYKIRGYQNVTSTKDHRWCIKNTHSTKLKQH